MTNETQFYLILQNQIDALNNGQFDFLLYNKGAGGEFLSSLICKYSKKYNYIFQDHYDSTGRYLTNIKILSDAFQGLLSPRGVMKNTTKRLTADEIVSAWPDDRFLENFKTFKDDYLSLDYHLNKNGRILVRTHWIHERYMNSENTYHLYPDNLYYKKYRYQLCRIKLPHPIDHCKGSTYDKNQASSFIDLPMSKIFSDKYLSDIFNISDEKFYEELYKWHSNNLKLIGT